MLIFNLRANIRETHRRKKMNDEPENISSGEAEAPPAPEVSAPDAPTELPPEEKPPVAEKKPDPIRHNSKRSGN